MALHDAALAGDVRRLNELLDGGADVNGPNQYRSSALLYAAKTNQLQAAALLIERGAHVLMPNNSKTTALHCAASTGNIAMCQLLVAKGADVRAEDEDGDSPIDVAEDGGWEDVCAFLRQQKLTAAEAELRKAALGDDARRLALALEKAEDEELVGPHLLSEAQDRLARLESARLRPKAPDAAHGAVASTGPAAAHLQAAEELEAARQALAEATLRLQQAGEAQTRRLLGALLAGAVAAGLLVAFFGAQRKRR